jgi:MFS family permease
VGAERILAGEIPYRDFWTLYAPGQYYLLAALFAVFGHDTLVSSIAGSLLCALSVGLVFRLMSRATGRRNFALACAAVAVAGFVPTGYADAINTYPPTIDCILAALNFLEAYLRRGRRAFLVGAGLACGLTALFKHDVGAYTAVALFAGVAVHHLVLGGLSRARAILSDMFWFGLAAAAPVLPVVVAFALVAGQEAYQDAIVFPATDFRLLRAEGYPSLLPFGFYDPWKLKWLFNWGRYAYFVLPLLIWPLGLAAVMFAIRRRRPVLAGLGAAFALAFAFHFSSAQVQVNTHIVSMTIYAACLGALALDVVSPPGPGWRASWPRNLAALVVFGWIGIVVVQPAYNLLLRQYQDTVFLNLPKVSWVRLPRAYAADLEALAEYVQRRVPPGEPIYVGNHRHDVVVLGRTVLYFVLDRPPGTRHHDHHPGVTDIGSGQAEIIRDLRRNHVKLLVLARILEDAALDLRKDLSRRAMPALGATALDEYIRANYAPAAQFGEFTVWLAKAP